MHVFLLAAVGLIQARKDFRIGPFSILAASARRCYEDIYDELRNSGLQVTVAIDFEAGSFVIPLSEKAKALAIFTRTQSRDGVKLRGLANYIQVLGNEHNPAETTVHGPSRIVVGKDGKYHLFETGPCLLEASSPDLRTWRVDRQDVPIPKWANQQVPGSRDCIWNPDIIYDKQLAKWVTFYGLSEQGEGRAMAGQAFRDGGFDERWPFHYDPAKIHNSVIGAFESSDVTTISSWTDAGKVLSSSDADAFNALDPGAIYDSAGNLWLTFGLAKQGIMIVQLDPLSLKPTSRPKCIASGIVKDLESPSIWRNSGYYFLFYTRGIGEKAKMSNQKIYVGRSKSVLGPYVDKHGNRCDLNGETVFLDSCRWRISPARGAVSDSGNVFSFYYLDRDLKGAPALGLARITLDRAGWPIIVKYLDEE